MSLFSNRFDFTKLFPVIRKNMVFTQIFVSTFPRDLGMTRGTYNSKVGDLVIWIIGISTITINMVYVKFRCIVLKVIKAFLTSKVKIFKNRYSRSSKPPFFSRFLVNLSPSLNPNRILFHFLLIFLNGFFICHSYMFASSLYHNIKGESQHV